MSKPGNSKRICFRLENQLIVIRLHDNPTSRDFYAMLPLRLRITETADAVAIVGDRYPEAIEAMAEH